MTRSSGRDRKHVHDMLVHITDADEIVRHGEEAFLDERSALLFRAAKSIVIDLSSAADRVSDEFTSAHPEVPWSAIHRMRSVLAHHYDNIQRPVVWDTLVVDLPAVRDALLKSIE